MFVEDNIYLGERWIVTPGLRFDHHSQFGNNTSPSLNAQFRINSDWVVKGGIARAFKAPNLYQSIRTICTTPVATAARMHCRAWVPVATARQRGPEGGNKPEQGTGHRVGTAERLAGLVDLLPNDYKDKIQAGYTQVGLTADTKGRIFRWENAPKAIVQA